MIDNVYNFLIAPALGCVTAMSLMVVAYLVSLEIKDRRRKRRLEMQLQQMELNQRYQRPSHYLASPKPTLVLPHTNTRLNLGQSFPKVDRTSGWNSTPNNLN